MIEVLFKGKRFEVKTSEGFYIIAELLNKLDCVEKKPTDITKEAIEELGFRISIKHGTFTRYIGDGCFMHLYLMERKDDPSYVQVFIGRDLEFENCEGIYKTVKCMEDLRELVKILG
jgi:hypothetical protein